MQCVCLFVIFLLVIVLSVLPRLTACDYLFGVFWSLCCLAFIDLRLVITSLVSFGHCVVCPSSTYGLWLPLVSFGHCVVCPSSTYGLWLPLWYLLVIVSSVLPRLTASNYLFGILWPLCCLFFFFFYVWLLITSLVSFGHCYKLFFLPINRL